MKTTKTAISVIMTAILLLTLLTPAVFADETGSITISGAIKNNTYSIYKLFDLQSYDTATNAYSYKVTSAWKDFCTTGAGAAYFDVDARDYIAPKEAFTGDGVAAFAAAALAYAKTNTIAATASLTAGDSDTKFEGLSLGYYLVDTTVGSLCSLGTTDPDATIAEKNAAPTLVKKVKEDSDSAWHDGNDADIGQTVEFKATITAGKGAENYVLHDKLSLGLTFVSVTSVTLNGNAVANTDYTVKTSSLSDGCSFEVVFTSDFCGALNKDDEIVVCYSATLNEQATVGGTGNPNEAWLTYGENNATVHDYTKTYTWKTDVFKYTGSEKTALAGVTFTLSKNADGSTPLSLVLVSDNTYRLAKTGDSTTVTAITTDATGKFTVSGLDADTYYLTETAHPQGYNGLAEAVKTVVGRTAENDLYDLTGTVSVGENVVTTVEIENTTGTVLPGTGGKGTVWLIACGCVLFIGTAIVLVTKKRLYNEG